MANSLVENSGSYSFILRSLGTEIPTNIKLLDGTCLIMTEKMTKPKATQDQTVHILYLFKMNYVVADVSYAS